MREILFRGKNKHNNEWIYGNLLEYPDGDTSIAIKNFKDNMLDNYLVFRKSVGQYTGLKDKDGTQIFEGDIVKGKDELEPNIEVYGFIDYMNGSFVIVGDFMTHYRWLDYSVEVIGNIYDNPELIRSDAE